MLSTSSCLFFSTPNCIATFYCAINGRCWTMSYLRVLAIIILNAPTVILSVSWPNWPCRRRVRLSGSYELHYESFPKGVLLNRFFPNVLHLEERLQTCGTLMIKLHSHHFVELLSLFASCFGDKWFLYRIRLNLELVGSRRIKYHIRVRQKVPE